MANKAYLPNYPYSDGIKKTYQDRFYGYNHTEGCSDGEIYDERNMTSDHFPVMAPRQKRYMADAMFPNVVGADYSHGRIVVSEEGDGSVESPYLVVVTYYPGMAYEGGQDWRYANMYRSLHRKIAWLGDTAVIMPDKLYVNAKTGESGNMAATSGVMFGAIFQNGTYAGESAEANTIAAQVDFRQWFKEGDAVKITSVSYPENNQTIIIREIQDNGTKLAFYENSFKRLGADASGVTVTREVPDLNFICQDDNRLWGCSDNGDTIYASKLGDPLNWNVFDGLASDSFAAETGTYGDFTACYSYNGYPLFFKEDHIFKVYGTKPSNYQITDTMTLGVEKYSDRSLAVASEVLYYKSTAGIMAYTGATPRLISDVFGEDGKKMFEAVGGSDTIKYYVSLYIFHDTSTEKALFVYDPRYNIWHREDDLDVAAFGWVTSRDRSGKCLICMTETGTFAGREMILNGETGGNGIGFAFAGQLEQTVPSWVEFGDFVSDDPNKKGISKIQARFKTAYGLNKPIRFSISFDGGEYEPIKPSGTDDPDIDTYGVKRSYYLPLTPRRTDNYKLKISGYDGWRLYALSRDEYSGSELQKH